MIYSHLFKFHNEFRIGFYSLLIQSYCHRRERDREHRTHTRAHQNNQPIKCGFQHVQQQYPRQFWLRRPSTDALPMQAIKQVFLSHCAITASSGEKVLVQTGAKHPNVLERGALRVH
jgi:hypothetical protein